VVPAAGTAVGSPSPFDGLPEDGWMAYLIDGQMHVVASVRDPTPREVAAARSAPVRMGLARPGRHLMVLGIEIAGFRDGWGEMPFALGLVEPERRRLLPPEMGGHGYVVMVLVDASTGLVEAFRPLRLPPAWTRRMHEIAEAQQDALSDFSPAAHDREVALFRALWPDTRALAAAFDTIAEAVDPGPTAR